MAGKYTAFNNHSQLLRAVTSKRENSFAERQIYPDRPKKTATGRRLIKNGADRDRTDDLYVANVPLSQLSYSPIIAFAGRTYSPTGTQYTFSVEIGKALCNADNNERF